MLRKLLKIIVESFKRNSLDNVKYLISENVYQMFDKAIDKEDKIEKTFHILTVKAAILDIKVLNKLAQIKVEFVSNQKRKDS